MALIFSRKDTRPVKLIRFGSEAGGDCQSTGHEDQFSITHGGRVRNPAPGSILKNPIAKLGKGARQITPADSLLA
jgi:hypothetical protein